MKKRILFLLSICLMMISCKKEIVPVISINKTEIDVSVAGGLHVISFESNMSWTARSSKSWCTVSPASGNEATKGTTITLSENDTNSDRSCTVTITADDLSKTLTINQSVNVAPRIPHFYIDTDDGLPITVKKEYKKGNVRIDGGDKYEDFEARTSIRGRGNSTWSMPKKPFRLKLDEKASFLGLSAEKDWVLLQNYIDPSLMKNAAAMKIGQLLEMPFTHHMIPVDVTLNDEYMGNYMLTEQKEVTESRINVGEGGWLIELDAHFDQDPWQFYSDNFELPVMIQYPKLKKMEEAEAKPIFNEMINDFNVMEGLIFDESFPTNDYLDYFDADAFVNYLIVYTLTVNQEINDPKSTYMYKKKDGKYNMGPIWDFDYSFSSSWEAAGSQFKDPQESLFGPDKAKGTIFFFRITQDPFIQDLYRKEWAKFKSQKYPILVEYLKEYAETIKESHAKDQMLWYKSSVSIDEYLSQMLDYLDKRVVYMDGLYMGK